MGGKRSLALKQPPPYKLSWSSLNMSMTSHSNGLSPTSPQLMPGMSLSVCICLNCFARRMAALEFPPGELVLRVAMVEELCKLGAGELDGMRGC